MNNYVNRFLLENDSWKWLLLQHLQATLGSHFFNPQRMPKCPILS